MVSDGCIANKQTNTLQLESMQHMSMYNIYTHIIYLATYYLHNIHVLYVTLWCQMVVLQANKQILLQFKSSKHIYTYMRLVATYHHLLHVCIYI